ncbi:hypothetical protein [Geomonas diazotrophica]|nr:MULTISPECIES: hypothetical protein [Geomonas]
MILAIVVTCVFCAAALALLNKGPMDRQSKQSTAYWARFEGK